jgi:hypothetical protein
MIRSFLNGVWGGLPRWAEATFEDRPIAPGRTASPFIRRAANHRSSPRACGGQEATFQGRRITPDAKPKVDFSKILGFLKKKAGGD